VGLKHEDESKDAALRLFAQGMSQSDIAKALRIAQSTVSRWCGDSDAEEARRLASLDDLQRLIAETEARAAEGAADHWAEYDAFGAPSGPEHDSHAHGLASGVWKCLLPGADLVPRQTGVRPPWLP